MQNNFSFILSGIIAFSFYGFLCFLLFFYIASPESKTLDLKSTATTIELDMITEIAEKKMVEKKTEKIIEKEAVKEEKVASASNEKRPDLKSLFANVKETAKEVAKEEAYKVTENWIKNEANKQFQDKIKELDNKHKINQAIALLQSNGYSITPPYIQPTDDEICDRIKSMNEEVGYVADFSVVDNKYYIYFVDNKYDYGGSQTCKILNTPYTTQSIAKQIVAELNEKRFVRV